MSNMQYSNLVPFSMGIVTANKDPNSDMITATPLQLMPFLDGELVDQIETYSVSVPDSKGNTKTISVNTTNSIRAKWLSRDPNVMTAPDVRRGAKVQLYQLANTDYYYWETITNTDNHQRLEEKIYAYSNVSKEKMDDKDTNNYYTQGVSTYRKHVNIIKTTKSDGEKWAYDINVDTKQGKVLLTDDIGNTIIIDSGASLVRLQNSSGTFLELNKKDINWGCENNNGKASKSVNTDAGQTINDKAGNAINLQASTGINSQAPIHAHTGNYSIAGGMSSSPGAGGSGMMMTGDMNLRGSSNITGDVVIGGISFLRHRHPETDSITNPPI